MPVDLDFPVAIGRDGLNLRDQAAEVPVSELVDSVNWRIDENGALVKRLGFQSWADSDQLAAAPLEQATFSPASGTIDLVFYCTDGHVYTSPGDGSFTSIASGLSTSARPTFAMLNDILYWANGVDDLQSWDGTTEAAVSGAPVGRYVAVWRNRLWISGDPTHPRRVYWSDILDPTTFQAFNYVDLAETGAGDMVTGMIPAPNIGASFDGADGLLVYMAHSTHRIFDDTDNTAGAIIGGGNVLIDGGTGTSSHRSLTHLNGRVWAVCPQGVYSTDGHGSLRLESGRLGSFFRNVVNPAHLGDATGIAWQGSYWLALASTGSAANDLIIEVYASYPTGPDQQHPVMAHTIPAAAWSIYPATTGDQLIFSDSSSGDTKRVRQYGVGGSDTDGQATARPITAQARSGAWLFGSPHPKRIRHVQAIGRGTLAIGFVEDLQRSVGEVKVFAMAAAANTDGPKWGSVNWGEFTWGGGVGASVGVTTDDQWYTRRGRLFQVTISESSTDVSSTDPRLGGSSVFAGGAALYSLIVRVTPLDAE